MQSRKTGILLSMVTPTTSHKRTVFTSVFGEAYSTIYNSHCFMTGITWHESPK